MGRELRTIDFPDSLPLAEDDLFGSLSPTISNLSFPLVARPPSTPADPPPAFPCPPPPEDLLSEIKTGSSDVQGHVETASPSSEQPELDSGTSQQRTPPDLDAEDEVDYYDVLGLDRNCNSEDIRRAYRSLAKVNHPDKNQSKHAKETFRLAAEAYSVLSDPTRKEQYDKGEPQQDSAANDHGSATIAQQTYSLLERIFGPGHGRAQDEIKSQEQVPAPAPVCVEKVLPVSLDELARGVQKCFQVSNTSGSCGLLRVNIKPGWRDGTRISFPGKGGPGPTPTCTSRDLVFVLKQIPHEFYQRIEDDLIADVKVPLVTALCGGFVQLPAFAGRPPLSLSINPGANLDRPLFISGQGMPRYDAAGAGALRINFKVVLPVGLTASQQDQLRAVLER
mmetsp:Transcript_21793/g.60564  ORF Transcript_21793/g.60564 Transcript_21793/m.60564 type:complete len:393 (+) Transcript_21793:335-1513(+)|eukprot:CAMPEP_0117654478 /NCGR_PEP_ID=MMETSP0804-20121206/3765_1 /TAXON_ID=1074897 /ORGANISM="Tetraselmis astigmatica, Strain CCMP880" /LENGTH=392 /DNA_ID=CAMNT_0005460761 /DNA_START=270 /DNA_END=1448 /DNA_ORIENTATION=+